MIWCKVAVNPRLGDVQCGSSGKTVDLHDLAFSCMASVAPICWTIYMSYIHMHLLSEANCILMYALAFPLASSLWTGYVNLSMLQQSISNLLYVQVHKVVPLP